MKTKDSIERFKQKRINDFSKQSQYLEYLLTATLPSYYDQNQNQQQYASNQFIQAKRNYVNDTSLKWNNNIEDSPLKLKKTYHKSTKTSLKSPSPKKLTTKQQNLSKSPNKSPIKSQKKTPLRTSVKSLSKSPPKNKIKSPHKDSSKYHTQSSKSPKKFSNKKQDQIYNEENLQDDERHPYSIKKHLYNKQKGRPDTERNVYKYREINELRTYNLQQVSLLIDDSLKRIEMSQTGKLSVTDQFLLLNYVDLKVQKMIEKSKIQQKKQKRINQERFLSHAQKQRQKNLQIFRGLQEVKDFWAIYQIKLNHCPDIMRKNGANQQIVLEMKRLFREMLKLQEQIEKHQFVCAHKKYNKSNPDPCYQSILKKIKNVIKSFKEIITIKRP